MLRLSRNKLTIHLRPSRVTISESNRDRQQSSGGSIDLPVPQTASWSGALEVLDQWLQENKRAGSEVTVHVADAYARYALIPWPADIVRDAELAIYSSVYFEELFGSSFENWDIKVDWREYGKASIGCALETAFLQQVKQLLLRHKLQLASFNTHFANVYNDSEHRLKKGDMLLVVFEAGQCVLATFKNKTWYSIRSVKVEEQVDQTLPLLVTREILLQGLPNDVGIYVHGDNSVVKQGVPIGENVVHLNAVQPSSLPPIDERR